MSARYWTDAGASKNATVPTRARYYLYGTAKRYTKAESKGSSRSDSSPLCARP